MHARERRLGLLLVAGGCLPFAAGALLAAPGEPGAPGGLSCPFRTVTGLPCPLCGATRAFALAARGDSRLWQFNAAWVVLAAAAIVAGAVALAGSLRGAAPISAGRDALAARLGTQTRVVALIALVLAIPWVYALAQRGTIA